MVIISDVVDDALVHISRMCTGGRRVLISCELEVEPRPLVIEPSPGFVDLVQASASLIARGLIATRLGTCASCSAARGMVVVASDCAHEALARVVVRRAVTRHAGGERQRSPCVGGRDVGLRPREGDPGDWPHLLDVDRVEGAETQGRAANRKSSGVNHLERGEGVVTREVPYLAR